VSDYRAKETLNTFAKLAADEYLGKSQTPLNSTLKKIASQEHLTPFQIEYVAAEANKSVWAKLFSMDKTASYDFQLADAKSVLKDLQIKQSGPVVNQSDLDYLNPPTSSKIASFDPMKALGIVEENMVKSAAARKEVKRQLQSRFEKMSAAKEELERLLIVTSSRIEDLELAFVKEARAMIMEQPFSERGAALDKVAQFLVGFDRHEESRVLMKKLSHVLKRQGLIKESDLKAPEEYISDKLPARVVNGRHSLYVTVKTIYDNYDTRNTLGSRYEIVDSSLPVVKEKIREL
jgi:RNase P protein component